MWLWRYKRLTKHKPFPCRSWLIDAICRSNTVCTSVMTKCLPNRQELSTMSEHWRTCTLTDASQSHNCACHCREAGRVFWHVHNAWHCVGAIVSTQRSLCVRASTWSQCRRHKFRVCIGNAFSLGGYGVKAIKVCLLFLFSFFKPIKLPWQAFSLSLSLSLSLSSCLAVLF